MTEVSIKQIGNRLAVIAPYHPDFGSQAKSLGGRWDPLDKKWMFDLRDEDRVSAMCKAVYGTDGKTPVGNLVTLRCICKEGHMQSKMGIYIAGRCVAYATGRDSGARLGEGVVLLAGKFSSGGSDRNWTTWATAGTIVEIRDVPVLEAATAIEEGNYYWSIEDIPNQTNVSARIDELKIEQGRLRLRLAEIETEIEKGDN